MKEAVILFIISLLISLFIIPWVKKYSLKIGYVDKSDGDPLKIHSAPIPHSGGIAIFGVFSLLILCIIIFKDTHKPELIGLLLGGGLIFLIGVWDDLKPTSQMIRLIGGIVAGVLLILLDHRIDGLILISIPVTIFYVVGAINAVNMADGLDGLAGGMTVISLLGFAIISIVTGQTLYMLISMVMSALVIGFLIYNFNPATIFLGDNGSYFIGFVLAFLAIGFTGFSSLSTFFAPILVIGVPVFDAVYAIMRRLKKGVSPFLGDRSHFYDQLVQKGLSVRKTVLICWGIQAVFVGCGVLIYLAAD